MKISKLRLIIGFIALFVMGMYFMISSVVENSKADNAELDFNYMSEYDFKKGMYVKGRVYEIYDEYAYEETYETTFGIKTNERVSSHFYLVPMVGTFETETPKYITVEISHVKMIPEAEKLMQQTWDYYDNGIEPTIWNEFDITGKVTPLDEELEGYLYEWFMYGDENSTRADYEDMICPYVITYHSFSGNSSGVAFGAGLTIIGAIGIAVFVVIYLKSRNTVPAYNSTYSAPYEPVPMGREYNPAQDTFNSYNETNSFAPPAPNNDSINGEMGYANPVTNNDGTSGEMGYANPVNNSDTASDNTSENDTATF